MLQPTFTDAVSVKILINIGALFDIPTGTYLKGKYNESILNGGLGMLTGITGIGNNFKSTLEHFMTLSAASKIFPVEPTYIATYDTEVNIHENRLFNFTQSFEPFKYKDILSDGFWRITDKNVYYGNVWWAEHRKYLSEIEKQGSKFLKETPFLSRDRTNRIKTILPTFTQIDSFTEFDTEEIAKIQNENELGDTGGNTIHMRLGLAKTRFLMEVPTITGRSNNFMLFTAHLGKDTMIAAGPYAPPPPKKLATLKHGDKLKGVTDKFFFLMSNLWQVYDARPLQNKDTKGPEYPVEPGDPQPNDTDLNVVTVKLLRSKSGPAGATFEVVVSQSRGVLPTLTEFHYIRSCDYFGLTGSKVNYHLDLLPEVNLSRTSIRQKIETEPLLARAMNITAELCQIQHAWRDLDKLLVCSPKELYDDLKEAGYDWNVLLKTRGYWMFENESHDTPFLSTMDLLRMRAGLKGYQDAYFPYWMNDDKTVKPGYLTAT